MALDLDLRIIVDGDSSKVYGRGDKVTGAVLFAVGKEMDISSLNLKFMGVITTATTRPLHTTSTGADARQSIREYEERVTLFNFEKLLLPKCTLDTRKRSWTFEFTFPDLTIPKYCRFQHGPKYCKDPHPLPPSFQRHANSQNGSAAVSYYLKATLSQDRTKTPLKVCQVLPYHPTPENAGTEMRVIPRILYAQAWKPLSRNQKAICKALSKLSCRNTMTTNNPRIVPTIYCPDRITTRKHIPILLSLIDSSNPSDSKNGAEAQCLLSSLKISIGTHTTSICGHPATQPEDTISNYVTCIDKTDLNQAIPFGAQVKLTNNFRLVDDAECVPSFKTYTITRRYDLTITIGIKYKDRDFTIRNNTAVEIVPRNRNLRPTVLESEDVEVDPLPLYTPRELSTELAPDYFSIYGPASSMPSASSASLSYVDSRSRGSSVTSGGSTSASEFEQRASNDCPSYYP